MTKKDLATNKALIEVLSKHSREYYNPREDVTRGKVSVDVGQDNLVLVISKLDTMNKRITKMGKSVQSSLQVYLTRIVPPLFVSIPQMSLGLLGLNLQLNLKVPLN